MRFYNSTWTNFSGLILSLACVLHCMLMPLCLASLPAWGLDWLVSPRVHQLLALCAVGIGLVTLIPGWRAHRKASVLLLALTGLMIMNFDAFAGEECCTPGEIAVEVASEDSVPSCCQKPKRKSCCAASMPPPSDEMQSDAELNPEVSESRLTVSSILSVGEWFQSHPTAFGAALLAWAHCLNGRCRRRCCQSGSDESVDLESGA